MGIDKLSIEEKIGQMFIIGLQGTQIDEKTIEMIKKYKVGGIILYRRNYNSYEQMLNIINDIKKVSKENKIPIFISIDQEGGRVNRMPKEFNNLKSATFLSETNNTDKLIESGEIIGKMLKKMGINMDYAPVFDIRRFEKDHAIGDRCYGKDKQEVAKNATSVMKAISKEGVIPVIKHFPGHGLTKKDSHFKIPTIMEKVDFIKDEDMYPFKVAIENGAEAIMIGHLIIKDIDKYYPATLSKKVINTLLKEECGYNGLIITDDFKMWAIKLHYSIKRAVVKSIKSGNDMVMIGDTYSKVKKVIKYTIKKAKRGKIDINSINNSVEKIVKLKEKYNVNNEIVNECNIEEINKMIDKVNFVEE